MTVCVIELNDFEIRVGSDHKLLLHSPGYAFAGEDGIEIGVNAANRARLQPRNSYNRYWKNLNQDPLQYPSAQARHNADLAFAHLVNIYEHADKPEEVIFAVPAIYTNEQLALLLGLVEASPLRAVGLVDSAVAAVAPVAGKGNYVHIDIHLHQSVLTRINVSEKISRSSAQLIDGVGMASIFDITAHLIADRFIMESRFDPQHHPETEQALYDQIPACLSSLRTHSEVSLEVQYQQTQHQAKLPAELLYQALQPQFEKIINAVDPGDVCLLSQHMGRLPGLPARLEHAEVLSDLNILQACSEHESIIRSSGPALDYVTSLPATSEPIITEIFRPAENTGKPGSDGAPGISHILHGHKAYPLNSERVYLSASGLIDVEKREDSHCSVRFANGSVRLEPTGELTVFVNGKQLENITEVEAGDIVSFAGSKTEYTFIDVKN